MNGISEILEELRSLSEPVAAISRHTPYVAPEGYFTNLPGLVLGRVAGWQHAKSLIYSVPEGYFDQFAQDVLARIKAGAGSPSKTGSPLDAGSSSNAGDPVYAGSSASGGGEQEPVSSLLAQIGRITPYQVPEGYFEQLSPLLTVLRDKNPYVAIPEGYFDSLSAVIAARTEQTISAAAQVQTISTATGGAKLVSLGSRAGRKIGWLKYSAAAVLAGLILTVGWLRYNQSAHDTNKPVDLAGLSKVSDEELQSFLTDQDTTLAQPLPNSTATLDNMNDTDLKTLLGDIPDGELKQYMEEHGGANDIATN